MDLSILVFIFLQFTLECTARWYMAVRPVYDLGLGNRTQTLNRTQRTPKKVSFKIHIRCTISKILYIFQR